MKTKVGTEVAHVTHDSDTTFKVKRSKVKVTRPLCSPPCWRIRRLQRWAWERIGRGKLLLRCRLLNGEGASAPTAGGEGRGIPGRPPAYSLFTLNLVISSSYDVQLISFLNTSLPSISELSGISLKQALATYRPSTSVSVYYAPSLG